MKKLLFLFSISTLLLACNSTNNNEDLHKEHDIFKEEIENLKIKLEATEAQLLNVSAELANMKGPDSTKVEANVKTDD
jgi:uncharacterized protein YcfL